MARDRQFFVSVLLAGLLARVANAADDSNKILYPEANLTFHYLDTVDVAFTTDYDTPWMYLWCLDSAGARQQIIYYSPSDVENRTVLPVQLQSDTQYTGSTCWFNLVPEQPSSNDDDIGVDSPQFSYIKEASETRTFSATDLSAETSAVTSSATQSSATSSNSAATTTSEETSASKTVPTSSASTETTSAKHSKGLSNGAKAAIGVVVGVVGLALLAAALILLRRRYRIPAPSSLESFSPKAPRSPPSYNAELADNVPAAQELGESKPWTEPVHGGAYELPAEHKPEGS